MSLVIVQPSAGQDQEPAPVPTPPDALLRLAFFADTGDPTESLLGGANSPMANLLAKWNPHKILLAGDCRYAPTTYAQGNTWLRNRLPDTVASPGNHDLDGDNGAAFYNFFPHPDYPAGLPGCFHVSLGNGLVDVIVVNDGIKTSGAQILPGGIGRGSPLQQWFSEVCASLTGIHRIVMVHHPLFSPTVGTNETLPELVWLTDAQYRVTAILNGHTHLSVVGHCNGVLCLNASATARSEKSFAATMQSPVDSLTSLEWAESETHAGCLISLTPERFSYEFFDLNGTSIHGGTEAPDPRLTVFDADVIAPDAIVANGDYYVTHAPASYYLDAVRISLCSPPRSNDANAATIRVTIKIDGVSVGYAELKSGSKRVATAVAIARKLVLAGQRITATVTSAPVGYAHPNPPKGLRVAQITRLIAA